MAQTLSRQASIHKDDLRSIAEMRLTDFRALKQAGQYAGAKYVGGYAVEAWLKRAICLTLGSEKLPTIFHVHDLSVLLFFSGLETKMNADPDVKAAFEEFRGQWTEQVLYDKEGSVTGLDCERIDVLLNDRDKGVLPWLRRHTA